MYFVWSITKKTKWRKKLKTKWRLEVSKHVHAKKHSYGVLYQSMPSCISRKCLLDGQTLAKTWCWRPRWPSKGQNVPLIMRKLRGYFPLFFRKTKNPLCSQGELVEKGWMALSQNTLKKIRRLFPPKDVNAMLKSILVTTANGKPQTASSRLPLAVNPMLKVSNAGSPSLIRVNFYPSKGTRALRDVI